MSNAELIRKSVKNFSANHPTAQTDADAFAAWWIHKRFKVGELAAAKGAPGGNHDYGIDAYYLDRSSTSPTLYLVQAKYTESLALIKKGFSGFIKLIDPLRAFLKGEEFSVSALNPVVHNLSVDIAKLRASDPDALARLQLSFLVIHLSDALPESINTHCKPAIAALTDALQDSLSDVPAEADQELPISLVPGVIVNTPPLEVTMRFHGEAIPSADTVNHLAGFGYLSDLVDLYEQYREPLFSKNVRYYQMDKAQKGPAAYMRETLRSICIPKGGQFPARPDSFALYHNGVTLTATAVTQDDTRTTAALRDPHILNGCQTIKSAFLMLRAEGATSKLIDIERWKQIVIPVRVVVTRDENLVRRITVGLNRQTAIRPAAFRANEPEQLTLEQRFADLGIFYERQEKRYKNLRGADPAHLSEKYPNTPAVPMGMEELAQSIAAAADKPAVSGISNVADLFEDALYRQVFSEERLADLAKLVFLRNVFACSGFVAKDLKQKSAALRPLQPGKFRFIIARVLSRYAIKNQLQEVEEYSEEIVPKFGPQHPLRLRMGAWCGQAHTGIQQLIPQIWGNASADEWLSPTDAEATQKLLRKARVESFDVFAV